MITNVIKAHPDETVEVVLERLEKHSLRCLPVVNDDGVLVGILSLKKILEELLPVSVTMPDGLQRLNFVVGATPGIAKRLHKLKPVKVKEVMEEDIVVVHPETETWESFRLIVNYGSPIPVVEKETGELVGLISEQSAIKEMHSVITGLEKEGELPSK